MRGTAQLTERARKSCQVWSAQETGDPGWHLGTGFHDIQSWPEHSQNVLSWTLLVLIPKAHSSSSHAACTGASAAMPPQAALLLVHEPVDVSCGKPHTRDGCVRETPMVVHKAKLQNQCMGPPQFWYETQTQDGVEP